MAKQSRNWDGSPEREKDTKFFDARESGYRGWIDQNGDKVSDAELQRRINEASKK